MAEQVASLYAKIGVDASAAKAGLAGFSKDLDSASGRMQKAGQSMMASGMGLTMGLTLPLVGVGVAAIKTASDFEASMSKIVGLVGVSREQVKAWESDLLAMSSRVGKTPKELADALYFVTSSGVDLANALNIVEVAARASSSGLGSAAVLADALTSAINAYGAENLSAAKAADILTAAVKFGKLEADAMAPVLGRLLPVSSALGIGFEQVAGTLAVMSRTGLDAAEAATSVGAIMSTLMKPSKEGAKALKEVGLSMGQLRDMVAQPGGLLSVLRLLDEKFGDNEEALTMIIPNIRALRGFMNVLAQDASLVDEVMAGVANSTGVADEAFRAASETTQFKFNIAMAELQSLLITVGAELLPMVSSALSGLTAFIKQAADWFKTLSPEVKQTGLVMLGLLAILGPLKLAIGAIMLAIGFLLSPIGLVVAAVGLLAAAWATNFGGIQEKTATLVRALRPLASVVSSRLWRDFQDVIRLLGNVMGRLGAAVAPLLTGIGGMASGFETASRPARIFAEALARGLEVWLGWQAVSKVVTITQTIIHAGQALITAVANLAGTVIQTIKTVGSLITSVANIASTITQNVVRTGAALITSTKDIVQKIKIKTDVPTDFFKGLATGLGSALAGALMAVNAGAILGAIGTAIAGAAAAIGGVISAPALAIGAAIVAAIIGAIAVWQNWGGIGDFFGEWAGKVGAWFGPFLGAIGEWFGAQAGNLGSMLGEWAQAIEDWFGGLPQMASDGLSNLANAISFAAGFAFQTLIIAASKAWGWLSREIPTWPGKIGSFLGGLAGQLGRTIGDAFGSISRWIGSAWDWIDAELPTWPGKIGNFLGGLAGQLGELFAGVLTAITGILSDLWTWIATEIPTWPGKIGAFLGGLAGQLGRLFSQVWTAVTDKLEGLWDWISIELPTWPEKFIGFLAELPEKAGILFGDLMTAATDKLSELWEAAKDWGGKIVEAILGPFGGLIEGIRGIFDRLGEEFRKGREAAEDIWGVGSPAKEAIRIGESIRKGFEIGLKPQIMAMAPVRVMGGGERGELIGRPGSRSRGGGSAPVVEVNVTVNATDVSSILREVVRQTEEGLRKAGFGGALTNSGSYAPM